MVVRGISTLALDMDGTLLNSAKQVSGRTQAALRALLGQGIDVVAVTGKAPALTASGVAPLALPMVCLDGAVHVVAGVERWVPGTMVDDALAAELLAAGDGPCYVIADGATFVRGPIEEPQFIDWSDRVAPLRSPRHLRRVTHLVFPHRERAVLAALARRVRAIAGRLGDQQLDLYLTEELFHGSYSLFIRSAACSKLGGMRALLKRLHCSESRRHAESRRRSECGRPQRAGDLAGWLSETMFMGDWMNDIPLLQAVGFPVAMRHAPPEVSSCARAVTLFTNDEEGVSRFLESYFVLPRPATAAAGAETV